MDRPVPLTALLLVVGLALFAVPLAAPAEEPPDRVTYSVEPIDGPVDSWQTLAYEDLSAQSVTAFDAALASEADPYEVRVDRGEPLPPLASERRPVVAYDLQYDGRWYLFQVKHFDPDAPASALYLRLGALVGGLALVVAGCYRALAS